MVMARQFLRQPDDQSLRWSAALSWLGHPRAAGASSTSRELFPARRADIEYFARDLETGRRARATITRRLCTPTRTWTAVPGAGSAPIARLKAPLCAIPARLTTSRSAAMGT